MVSLLTLPPMKFTSVFLLFATAALFWGCESNEAPSVPLTYKPSYSIDTLAHAMMSSTEKQALPGISTLTKDAGKFMLDGKVFTGKALVDNTLESAFVLFGGGRGKQVVVIDAGKKIESHFYQLQPMVGYSLTKVERLRGGNPATCVESTNYTYEDEKVLPAVASIDSTTGTSDFRIETRLYPIQHTHLRHEVIKYENGRVVETETYSLNQVLTEHTINGAAQTLTLNGTVETLLPDHEVSVATYANGVQTGPSTVYNASGNLVREAAAVNGTYVEYYADGAVKMRATLKDGKFEGESQSYYEDGKEWRTYTYKNGLKDGPWKALYKNGKVGKQGTYKADAEAGLYEEFYDTGDKWKTIEYQPGGQFSTYSSWYNNGNQAEVYTMKNGYQHGPYAKWNTKGSKIIETGFRHGQKHGQFESWNEAGKPAKNTWYFGGKEESAANFIARTEAEENKAKSASTTATDKSSAQSPKPAAVVAATGGKEAHRIAMKPLSKTFSANHDMTESWNLPVISFGINYPSSAIVERARAGQVNDNYVAFYFRDKSGQAMENMVLGWASGDLSSPMLCSNLLTQLASSFRSQASNLEVEFQGQRFLRGRYVYQLQATAEMLDEDTNTMERFKMLVALLPSKKGNGIALILQANDKNPAFESCADLGRLGITGAMLETLDID